MLNPVHTLREKMIGADTISAKSKFQDLFEEYSPAYNQLSKANRCQFFSDLDEWPNPPQVDWIYMLVNCITGENETRPKLIIR